MSCWSVLELEANASLKEIKKSYAKKLKHNKPDENPEGFQRLNAAYQQACKIAKNQARQQAYEESEQALPEYTEPNLEQNLEPESQTDNSHIAIPVPLINKEISEQEFTAPVNHEEVVHSDEHSQQEPGIVVPLIEKEVSEHTSEQPETETYTEDDLIHDVDELMESHHINDLSKWEALLNSQLLYEIRFRGWFTLRLFYLVSKKIAENEEEEKQAGWVKNEENRLSHETLIFLNQKMMWTNQTDRLEAHFEFEEIERVKNHLIPKKRKETFSEAYQVEKEKIIDSRQQHASIFKRLAAFIIDFILVICSIVMVGNIIDYVPKHTDINKDYLFLLYPVMIYFLFPFLESKIQATIGKWLVGIKVVNRKGEKIGSFKAQIRFVFFLCNLALFKVTFLINAFMFDGRLLHDRLSFSKVVDRSQND